MYKFTKLFVAATVVMTMVAGGVASAAQIDAGNIHYSRNLTKNGAFGDPTQADPCDVVQFRVRLHNGGPEVLDNVNVRVTLPSGTSNSFSSQATTTSSNGNPSVVSDTAAVNASSVTTINYVVGSAELLDANGGTINPLSDALFTSGVDVGSVGVSIQQIRFVQYEAELDCPEDPVCPQGTTGIYPKCDTPKTPDPKKPTPTTLPNTGAGSVLAIFAGVTALSSLAYSAVARRSS